jgi:hypothetical protein
MSATEPARNTGWANNQPIGQVTVPFCNPTLKDRQALGSVPENFAELE